MVARRRITPLSVFGCFTAALLGGITAWGIDPIVNCQKLEGDSVPICSGCISDSYPGGCGCEESSCPDLGLIKDCQECQPVVYTSQKTIVVSSTVPCWKAAECKPSDSQQDPCVWTFTGQSTETGTMYEQRDVERCASGGGPM
jgi:hypothetical protein